MNYSRNPLSNLPPVTKNLLIINVICFIPYLVFSKSMYDNILDYTAFHYFNSSFFKPWQPLTYMFFHGGWMHIIFNMFALYSFGNLVEYTLGSKRFFNYYFICGLGAVALQMLVQMIEVHGITGGFTIPNPGLEESYYAFGDQAQNLYNIYNTPMVGASGAIFGLLIAFGMLYPNMELMVMFIPIPVKAKYIIPVYIVLELFLGVQQYAGDSVAHFAHLGGALIGFLLLKIWHVQRPNNFF